MIYEYCVNIQGTEGLHQFLTRHGDEGWALQTVMGSTFIFMRPKVTVPKLRRFLVTELPAGATGRLLAIPGVGDLWGKVEEIK